MRVHHASIDNRVGGSAPRPDGETPFTGDTVLFSELFDGLEGGRKDPQVMPRGVRERRTSVRVA